MTSTTAANHIYEFTPSYSDYGKPGYREQDEATSALYKDLNEKTKLVPGGQAGCVQG